MSSTTFLTERLAKKKEQLERYEATLAAALENQYSAHSLDTGQTRQSLQTHSIGQLQNNITTLEAEIVRLEQRLSRCGASQGRPAW